MSELGGTFGEVNAAALGSGPEEYVLMFTLDPRITFDGLKRIYDALEQKGLTVASGSISGEAINVHVERGSYAGPMTVEAFRDIPYGEHLEAVTTTAQMLVELTNGLLVYVETPVVH